MYTHVLDCGHPHPACPPPRDAAFVPLINLLLPALVQWYVSRQNRGAAGPAKDRLEPSNIGKKIAGKPLHNVPQLGCRHFLARPWLRHVVPVHSLKLCPTP